MTPNTKVLLSSGVDDALRSMLRAAKRLRDDSVLDLAELAYAAGEIERLRRLVERENARAGAPTGPTWSVTPTPKRARLRVVGG